MKWVATFSQSWLVLYHYAILESLQCETSTSIIQLYSGIRLKRSNKIGTHLILFRRSTRYLQSFRSLHLSRLLQVEPTKEELKQRKRGEPGSRESMRNTSRRKRGGLHLDNLRLQFCKRHLSKRVGLWRVDLPDRIMAVHNRMVMVMGWWLVVPACQEQHSWSEWKTD